MATPDIQGLISQAAADTGVPTELLTALLTQESSLRPDARNVETGAAGMAQLMPTTARMLGVSNPNNPAEAIPAAARYLKQGLDKYNGDVPSALKYYYGGPNEHLWGPRTQAYPGQVLARLQPALGSDPNNYLGIPPAAAPAALGDMASRFGNYLSSTVVPNLLNQFPAAPTGPKPITQAANDPQALAKVFGLVTGFSGGGLTFGGTASKEVEQDAAELLPKVWNKFHQENPKLDDNELNQHMWEQTSWFKGEDGKWRYEIPDFDASLPVSAKGVRVWHGMSDEMNPQGKMLYSITEPTTLGEILDHPQLFDAYPELKNLKVEPLPSAYATMASGMMDQKNGILYLGAQSPQDAMYTILHETQHRIQYLENFARGGSPREFLPEGFEGQFQEARKQLQDLHDEVRRYGGMPFTAEDGAYKLYNGEPVPAYQQEELSKLPRDLIKRLFEAARSVNAHIHMREQARENYNNLAGEVESRNVEARLAQGETGFPLHTEGYPMSRQTIIFHNGTRMERVEHNPWLEPIHHDPFALSPVGHDPFK